MAGQQAIVPDGDIDTAKINFTSGASFNAANWTPAALSLAGLRGVVADAEPAGLTVGPLWFSTRDAPLSSPTSASAAPAPGFKDQANSHTVAATA